MLIGVMAASLYLMSCADGNDAYSADGADKGNLYGSVGDAEGNIYSTAGDSDRGVYSTAGDSDGSVYSTVGDYKVVYGTGKESEGGTYSVEYIDASEYVDVSENLLNDVKSKGIDTGKYTIVIDSGHGGIDPGKTGSGVNEKDINLEIALKLSAMLEGLGYNIVMTRTTDEGLYSQTDTNKKRQDLKKRCEIANSSGADIMISIHQNSFSSSTVSGAQVFYYTYSTQGKRLAKILQQSFKTYLDSANTREIKSDKSYYLLLHSKIPTVIAECGFLTNADELVKLIDDEYQNKIAEAIAMGVNMYFAEE